MTLRNRLVAVLTVLVAAVGLGVLLPGPASAHSSCYNLPVVLRWQFPGAIKWLSGPSAGQPLGGMIVDRLSNGHDCVYAAFPPQPNGHIGYRWSQTWIQASGQPMGEVLNQEIYINPGGSTGPRAATANPAFGKCVWAAYRDGLVNGQWTVGGDLHGVACY